MRTVHGFGYAFQGTAPAAEADSGLASGVIYRLVWKGGRAALSEGEHVLGRDAEVSVVLDSSSVSRRHARIVIADGTATIEDLGSKNGTFLGNQRIRSALPLADGARLRVGSIALTFRIVAPAGSTETAASHDRTDG